MLREIESNYFSFIQNEKNLIVVTLKRWLDGNHLFILRFSKNLITNKAIPLNKEDANHIGQGWHHKDYINLSKLFLDFKHQRISNILI
jgi:hypothetical protein